MRQSGIAETCSSESEVHKIERAVTRWTLGRVKDLRVRIRGEDVYLDGRSETYYMKQLAQHGVFELVPTAEVHNAIVVQ